MKEFNNLVFNKELEITLEKLLKDPIGYGTAHCLFGFKSNGKTSFSKLLTDEMGCDSFYVDIGKYIDGGQTVSQLSKNIEKWMNYISTHRIAYPNHITYQIHHTNHSNHLNVQRSPVQNYHFHTCLNSLKKYK